MKNENLCSSIFLLLLNKFFCIIKIHLSVTNLSICYSWVNFVIVEILKICTNVTKYLILNENLILIIL